MDYKIFVEIVKEKLQKKFGDEYFFDVNKTIENNGIVVDALTALKKGSDIILAINLNVCFEELKAGVKLEDIAEEIFSCIKTNEFDPPNFMKNIPSFNDIRDRVFLKLISLNRNEKFLSDIPFTQYLDLAIVYYVIISSDEKVQTTILVRNTHLKLWNITLEELHHLAKNNSQAMLPSYTRPIQSAMYDIANEFTDDEKTIGSEDLLELMDYEQCPLVILSNETGMYGAACMLYDGVLEQISQRWHAHIIILPSSVHEVLLMPVTTFEDIDFECIKNMVMDINHSVVSPREILSNHVYFYNRKDGKIHIAI